jgi:putative hydrolase of the HAD superfamily
MPLPPCSEADARTGAIAELSPLVPRRDDKLRDAARRDGVVGDDISGNAVSGNAVSGNGSVGDGVPEAPAPRPDAALLQLEKRAALMAQFAHVDTWVFDLDNTLYPSDSGLWPSIDQRITLYLGKLFGLDGISSRALQKYYYQRYGTTLGGLVIDHAISFEDYLSFVHDIDRSSLVPNLALAEAIAALPGRKLILTNGSRDHALRTTEALGLAAMFEDIFDTVAANLVPKPASATYQRFFEKHGVDPTRAAMFEDIAANLVIPHEKGMRTTLVVPKPGQLDHREAFEIVPSAHLHHVDFVTADLDAFLREIVGDGAAAA